MSWINSRQHGGPPPINPAAPLPPMSQSGSVGFGSGGGGEQQDWQQQPQQQSAQNYSQQPQQYPSQQSQIPSNNLYNIAPPNPGLRNQAQQNWQQPPMPQQQYQQTQTANNQFYNKQPPVVDNYVQQTLLPSQLPITQQYQQQQPLYQQQLPASNVPAHTINQQSFMTAEQSIGMESAQPTQQNEIQAQGEGWSDWDWNDNNQLMQGQGQHDKQNIQNVVQPNILADSFSTEQVDNWKWNSDENNSNILQSSDIIQNQFISNEQQHGGDLYGPSSLGLLSTSSVEDQSMKQTRPSSVGLAAPSLAPPTLQQPNIQLDSSGNAVSNNVYVSQAKPVAQPSRQFAMTPLVTGPATPPDALSDLPPPTQTPPQPNAGVASMPSMPPPPPIVQATSVLLPPPSSSNVASNSYKRVGAAHHHRTAMAPAKTQQPNVMPTQFYGGVSGDFHQTQQIIGNQEILAPDNSEVIADKNFEVENLEVAPSNDRNQYLQTGHLSEEGYNNVELAQEQNELDNFPPPGLSRLVLGQPEVDSTQSNSIGQSEIPPGLDRMVPGTELVTPGINLERQADGQDTIPAPRSAFANVPPVEENDPSLNIDITADRNLYLVPGESDVHEQRIVTGLENGSNQGGEQREVELDGENLEDQQLQQQLQSHFPVDLEITRDEPIEGANTLDPVPSPTVNHETESSLTVETNQKDVSNPSTCNDDSDHKPRHPSYYGKSSSGRQDDKKRRTGGSDTKHRKELDESEDSDCSSDRDRRRYREGSVRNDRDKDRESKERDRREKREGSARDRYRDEKDRDVRRYDRDRHRDKYDRDRDRDRGRHNNSRYETDPKYETESSTRYERRRGGDRGERNNDHDYRRDEKDKQRYRRGGERHGDRDDQRDRRRDNDRDYRDRRRDPREKGRGGVGSGANEYDDDYRRTTAGSRNARESDRDIKDRSARDAKDPRYQQNMYGYSAGYGYDAYTYYQQQQQYYEQLRRTNPQAYAEWYRKYYGQMQNDLLANDGRESVHSGRSSANNDKDRSDPISSSLIDATTQDPARSTPCKFITDHSTVSLASGLVVCVKPKYSQNGITNVVKVLKFAPNDSTRRLFHSFPGPLVRGITHKKTIIEFCEDQIRLGPPSAILRSRNNSVSSICSMGQANKASFTLMWTLLILLLRQNGMVVGTDIAELLMKNKNQFPYESNSVNALKSTSNSRRNSVQSEKKSRDRISSSLDGDDDSAEDKEEPSEESDSKQILSELEITEKFRNHLLYGNVNEALEWATENNLWGHALFLASKVDRRSHANVMMKFANKLSLNDPLQTLYQLMSGRTPSSVTSIQDEKWGDWRPHLAMILSNTSQRPDLDRKAITTLGDSLYNRGDLFGAQFCYLMAQVGFGRYSSVNQESSFMPNSVNAVRLVLLGSSHHKAFRDFATNEAIMMTEIYEYACALNDDKFSLIEFQPYKYLLALRMLDYGLQLKTLMYMEQIAGHMQLDPSKYEISLIEKVYVLSDRLKFIDPVLEKSMDDQLQNNEVNQLEDQQWLQDLRVILNDSNIATLQNIPQQANDQPSRSLIDQQFAEINQQFSELNLQYNDTAAQQQHLQQQSYGGVQPATMNEAQFQPNSLQYQQTPNDAVEPSPQSTDQYGQFYNPNPQMNSLPDYGNYGHQNYEHPSYEQQTYEPEPMQSLPLDNQLQGQSYGQWNPQQNESAMRPTISMPNSLSQKSGFYDDTAVDNAPANVNASKSNGNATTDKKISATKLDNKKHNSGGNTTANSGWFGGIWNKLSLKPKNQMILPDDKNPSIVWDPDKKKWVNTDGEESAQESFKPPPKMADVVHTAYNNQQGGNGGQQMPPQPSFGQQTLSYSQSDVPMVSSNIPQPSTSPGLIPSANTTNSMNAAANANAALGGEQMKTPSLQSNMFKLQRNRTLKKSYVDVFNPSGAPPSKAVENVLAPILPPAAVPQSGFFIPSPIQGDDSSQQQSQDGMPQFYNPNQFSGFTQ